jgi:3-hydroxypropanoate dehydrogenase
MPVAMSDQTALANHALDKLFNAARTVNAWLDKAIPEPLIHQLYELTKMGPTSANSQPARFVFVESAAGKARLKPLLMDSNVAKTVHAPLTVIVGMDLAFYERLPEVFPHTDARSWFVGNDALIYATAFRNSSLQGAYLMMAARALGLDCGPMSGFDAARVEAEFFPNSTIKANFLINIGYGDYSRDLFARSPRLRFEDVVQRV